MREIGVKASYINSIKFNCHNSLNRTYLTEESQKELRKVVSLLQNIKPSEVDDRWGTKKWSLFIIVILKLKGLGNYILFFDVKMT